MPRSSVHGSAARKVAVVLGVCAVVAGALLAWRQGAPDLAGWREIELAWHKPAPWEASRAFECTASRCGTPVTLLVQAKVGLCNCETGIRDDDDLERMSDLALLGGASEPQAPGHAVEVSGMSGRARAYAVNGSTLPVRSALAIAYNERCDMVVATAMSPAEGAAPAESAVRQLLESPQIVKWVEAKLGL